MSGGYRQQAGELGRFNEDRCDRGTRQTVVGQAERAPWSGGVKDGRTVRQEEERLQGEEPALARSRPGQSGVLGSRKRWGGVGTEGAGGRCRRGLGDSGRPGVGLLEWEMRFLCRFWLRWNLQGARSADVVPLQPVFSLIPRGALECELHPGAIPALYLCPS